MKKQTKNAFPEINFWDRRSQQISIINPEDFWKDELFSKLNLSNETLKHSMGSSDRAEVVERQNIMTLLQENPELRKFAKNGVNTQIPSEGQRFLDEFNPEKTMSPFAEKVSSFIGLLSNSNKKSPLVGKIANLFSFLTNNINEINQAERKFGEIMGHEIEKASKLHGRTTFMVCQNSDSPYNISDIQEFDTDTEEGFGYRYFSFKLSKKFKIFLDSKSKFWTKNNIGYFFAMVLSIIIFPVGILIWRHNRKYRKMAFKPMIIEEVPKKVKTDIENFLKDFLVTKPNQAHEEARKEGKKNLPKIPSFKGCASGNTFIEIYYHYEKEGLYVRVLRVYSSETKEDRFLHSLPKYNSDFFGYSASYIKKIKNASRKLMEDATSQVSGYSRTSKLLNFIQILGSELLQAGILIPSYNTDREFKYYTISEASNLPHVVEHYNKVMGYRNFFSEMLVELKAMTSILEKILNSSEEWGIPVEYPEILPDGEHVIGFETIYPIHLIGREAPDGSEVEAKDLVPINSLPPLNGQIVGLTGQNGGGKTATLNELAYILFLAQSGLPVFGTGVKLNVKTTLGLIFNTRGEGSQLQNFIGKTKKVFEAIKEAPSNATVVLVDELGSGAQHEDGIQLGKEILKTLRNSRVSTIFNTQLPEIASYSEKELGAVCFKFTLDHQVRKGIGSGNASVLAKQMGLDKFFVEN